MTDSAQRAPADNEIVLPKRLADWQDRLLRGAHATTTAVLFVAPILSLLWLGVGSRISLVAAVLSIGLINLGLLFWKRESSRLTTAVVLATLVAAQGMILLIVGWAPAFIAMVVLLVVLTGVLTESRMSYAMAAGVALEIAAAGWLVQTGIIHIDEGILQTGDLSHWLRTGSLVVMIGGATVYLLRHSMLVILEVRAGMQTILHQTDEEFSRAEQLRAELIETEIGLRETHKVQAVSQLSVGIAHHISNLLTLVRDRIDLIKAATSIGETRAHAIGAEQIVTQGAPLLANLNAFSRHRGFAYRQIDVGDEVRAFRDGLGRAIRDDIQLSIEVENGCWAIADSESIKQLLLAAVLNASDAVSRGGRIEIVVRRESISMPPLSAVCPIEAGPYVAVIVRDTGAGMTEQVRRQATDPFFTTKESEEHTGLGLSSALGIARAAGGGLMIESSPGEGSTITALLPSVEPGHAASAQGGFNVQHRWPPGSIPENNERPAPKTPPKQVPETSAKSKTPEQPDAHREGSDLDLLSWREAYVLRLIRALFPFFVLAGALASISGSNPIIPLTLLGGAIVSGIGAWTPDLRSGTRLLLLLSSLTLISWPLVLLHSYRAPGPLASCLFIVSLSAVLGSRRSILTSLALLATLFIVGGILHGTGVIVAPMEDYTASEPANWYRVAIMMGICLAILAYAVLGVVEHARASVLQIQEAIATLHQTRSSREKEHARMLHMEQMAGSTARVEAAGRLAGAVVHDLNNALQAVMGCAWEIRHLKSIEGEAFTAAVEEFETATDYATALVGRFDLRLELTQTHCDTLDLGQVVKAATDLVRLRLPKELTLQLRLQPHCYVRADNRDIYRLVFNLTQNAQFAMESGGTVTVEVTQLNEQEVALSVEDDGVGMDEALQKQAQEAFFTTRAHNQGTGLGLTAVASVVRRTDGQMSIDSSPGVGTRVIIHWPAQSPPKARDVSMSQTRELSSATILLADDHEQVREVFCAALRRKGFRVLEAADGDEARDLLVAYPDIDLVCLDGVMPGYPTQKLIADALASKPHRPVIVCSGYMPTSLDERLIADDIRFVPKPVGGAELASVVSDALAESQQASESLDSPV